MRLFFTILSLINIAVIFLFADSPVVSDLSAFNPYSILHIPLYGILTFFLIFSIVPTTIRRNNPTNPTNSTNALLHLRSDPMTQRSKNPINPANSIKYSNINRSKGRHSRESGNPGKHWIPGQARNDKLRKTYVVMYNAISANNLRIRFLIAGLIALIVGIADEIHQAYIPNRNASITDVLLDFVGITLTLFFIFRVLKTRIEGTKF